uniref:Uncharacterized protein n=1 Tax=Trichogramma kaykai TaxID=54128 RepID=A0ABD2W493_9HYME
MFLARRLLSNEHFSSCARFCRAAVSVKSNFPLGIFQSSRSEIWPGAIVYEAATSQISCAIIILINKVEKTD